MSIHKSLKTKNQLKRTRSVYTRFERLEILKERGLWKEGDKVLGLPKVRTAHKAKKKPKKVEDAAAAAAPAEGAVAEKKE